MMSRSIRSLILAAMCFAAIADVPSATAASKFDGRWSVVLTTKSGSCDPAYRGEVLIYDGLLEIAGGSNAGLTGSVSSSGAVTATGKIGLNSGSASGQLSTSSGNGIWQAKMQDGLCSGVWTAERRGDN
jgi:hypothetical protein